MYNNTYTCFHSNSLKSFARHNFQKCIFGLEFAMVPQQASNMGQVAKWITDIELML